VRPIAAAQVEKAHGGWAFVILVKGKEKWQHRPPNEKTPREAGQSCGRGNVMLAIRPSWALRDVADLEDLIPIDTFMAKLERDRVPRVPGTAVFLTRAMRDTPPLLAWHVRHNRALQEHVLAITTQFEPVATVAQEAPGFWRASVRYGFMERPDTPRLLAQLKERGCTIDLSDVTYYVGHETVTRRQDGGGLPGWQEELFAFMERNAAHVTDYFNLPGNQVVEIGRQIAV
jgi:KUP system potassium uptake protein